MSDDALVQKEELAFESLQELRGEYYVEYSPPAVPHIPHAMLSIVFCGPVEANVARMHLEIEMRRWLNRYPFPLMAAAYDEKEDAIDVSEGKFKDYLFGWVDSKTKAVIFSSKPGRLDQQTKLVSKTVNLREMFIDIPYRTRAQLKSDGYRKTLEFRRHSRILKLIMALWLAVIPGAFAVVEYFGPEWLGAIVCLYGLWKASQTFREVMGYVKPTAAEVEAVERKRKMEHYYYHCEQNPRGFSRLKIENYEEESRRRVQKDFELLKSSEKK